MEVQEREHRLKAAMARIAPSLGAGAVVPGEPTGIDAMDRQLVGGGLPKGALTEIMTPHVFGGPGGGALALFMPMLKRLSFAEQPRWSNDRAPYLAVIDNGLDLYPPALVRSGIDLSRLLILRPRRRSDALWAMEQCARSDAVAMTIMAMPRLHEREIRRFQLAAESGKGVCVLFRPDCEQGGAAPLRLRILPRPTQVQSFRVEFLRCRGARLPAPLIIEVDHGTTMALSASAEVSLSTHRAHSAFAAG